MITSTMAAVIDDLVTIAKANFADPWVVSDGPWEQTQPPNRLVAVGLAALSGDEISGAGVQGPATLGQPMRVTEDYTVVNEIFCWTGNTDPAAQKLVRDQAMAALAVFETTLRTRSSLPQASVLAGGAWIESVNLIQLDPAIDQGRLCRIHFDVHIKNILTN